MGNAEATDAKIDALSKNVGEVKQDVRELRRELRQEVGSLRNEMGSLRKELHQEVGSLRNEMGSLRKELHQEVGALRNEMGSFRADTHAALTVMCESIAELRGSTKTMNWIVGILATLVVGMFAVDKAPRLLKAMVPADETTPVAAAADLTQ